MKFGFIAKHRGIWPVRLLCETLDVSQSGFYAWASRRPSARARSDERVGDLVKTSFLSSDRTYGARRVWHDVLAEGIACGLHRIERPPCSCAPGLWPARRGRDYHAAIRAASQENLIWFSYTDPKRVCVPSSQSPGSRCCDDRLNPPSTRPSHFSGL